jgi:hypothetical protein
MFDRPYSISFSVFPVTKPTLTVSRRGRVLEFEDTFSVDHAKVILNGGPDHIRVTNAQSKAVIQIIRAVLDNNPCCTITFGPATSPWGWDVLQGSRAFEILKERMKLPVVDGRKLFPRQHPLYPAIQEQRKRKSPEASNDNIVPFPRD